MTPPETGGDRPRPTAAFDFDGTLTVRDSFGPFLREVCGTPAVVSALLADLPRLGLVAAGRASRDAAKARLIARLLAGHDAAELASAGRRYGSRLVRGGLRDTTRARLRYHQAAGHRVVVVSASPSVYLDEVGRALGIDAVLCTRLEVRDGIVTGALDGGNCRGPEKARRLRAWLAPLPDTGELWVYGDSAGDDEMLAVADRPVRIDRRGRLPATAMLTRPR